MVPNKLWENQLKSSLPAKRMGLNRPNIFLKKTFLEKLSILYGITIA